MQDHLAAAPPAKSSFAAQYRDPRWQRKRLEVMEAADFRCQSCESDDRTLNVHHRKYIRGRAIWEYGADELQCLCEDCHKRQHQLKAQLASLIAVADEVALGAILGFSSAYIAANVDGCAGHLGIRLSNYEMVEGALKACTCVANTALEKVIEGGATTVFDLYEALE